MPREHRKKKRAGLAECNGFKVDQDVIVFYDDNKNRHGFRGKITRLGKRSVVVRLEDGDLWEGTWYRALQEYGSKNCSTHMKPCTQENEILVGDRSAYSPPRGI